MRREELLYIDTGVDEESRIHCIYGHVVCSPQWKVWIKLKGLVLWETVSKNHDSSIYSPRFPDFFVEGPCANREKEYGVLHGASLS